MADSSSSSSDSAFKLPLALPAIVVLAAGSLAAWLWQTNPLTSTRPLADGAATGVLAIGDQTENARLWQDPFQAVAAQTATTNPSSRTLQATIAPQIARRIGDGKQVLVLPTLIDRSPYAENQEWRLRSRYAVLTSMSTAGYIPDDDRHIGLCQIDWHTDDELRALIEPQRFDVPSDDGKGGLGQGSSSTTIAFEWFRRNETFHGDGGNRPSAVLVLWMDDGMLAYAPATRMARFLETLDTAVLSAYKAELPKSAKGSANDPYPYRVAVLGPDSSTTLRALLSDPLWQMHDGKRWLDWSFHRWLMHEAARLWERLRETRSAAGWRNASERYIERLTPVIWYSSHATAPSGLLTAISGTPGKAGGSDRFPWRVRTDWRLQWGGAAWDAGPVVYRTHCADDLLVRELLVELRRRGIDLSDVDATNDVLLLSESETFYGRALPLAFKACVLEARDRRLNHPGRNVPLEADVDPRPVADQYFRLVLARPQPAPSELTPGHPLHFAGPDELDRAESELAHHLGMTSAGLRGVDAYTYLRGLDGITGIDAKRDAELARQPGSAAAGAANAKKTETTPFGGAGQTERPDGSRQVDYVRRLAVSLVQRTEQDHRPVKAIGVLGSDVYDKLLLIRALREAYPEALLFTTDLDNRLSHADELPYTRNLIVVSGFGLQLSAPIQAGVPPFRDSYQTATYLSALRALHHVVPDDQHRGTPRVFEIGRNGPYDLSPDIDAPAWTAGMAKVFGFDDMQPLQSRRGDARDRAIAAGGTSHPVLAILLLVLAGGCMLTPIAARYAPVVRGLPHKLRVRRRARRIKKIRRVNLARWIEAQGVQPQRWWNRAFNAFLLGPVVFTSSKESPGGEATSDKHLGATRALLRCAAREDASMTIAVVALVLSAIGVALVYRWSNVGGGGEPLALFEGISIWPTQFIRLAAVFLTILFAIRGHSVLRRNAIRISMENGFAVRRRPSLPSDWREWLEPNRRPQRHGRYRLTSNWRVVRWVAAVHAAGMRWVRFLRTRTVSAWSSHDAKFVTRCGPEHDRVPRTDVAGLWAEYMWLGHGPARLLRVSVLTAFCLLLGYGLVMLFGWPARPYRGAASDMTDAVLMTLSSAAMVGMTFYVVDAVRLCEAFCRQLTGCKAQWTSDASQRFAGERGLSIDDVDDLLDIRLIAARTEGIGSLVFYPFVLLLLMFLARSRVFDRWEWPLPLVLIYAVVLGYAIWSVAALQRSAMKARRNAVERLQRRMVCAKSDAGADATLSPPSASAPTPPPSPAPASDWSAGSWGLWKENDGSMLAPPLSRSTNAVQQIPKTKARTLSAKSRVEQLSDVIAEIRDNRKGAFAPLAQHPVITSVLVAFGGSSIVKALEIFTMF